MKSFYIGVKGIINQANAVLLLKRLKQGTYYWDCPGGRMDEGEEIEDTLVRELQEEIGNGDVSIGKLLTIYKLPHVVEDDHALLLVFYEVQGSIKEVTLSSEHEDFIWVRKEEIEDFIKQECGHLHEGTIAALRATFIQ